MKSKIVRGIINGGVLAAVAALGITVYQLEQSPSQKIPRRKILHRQKRPGWRRSFRTGKTQKMLQLREMAGRMQHRMRFLMEKTEMKQVCQEFQKPEQMQTE